LNRSVQNVMLYQNLKSDILTPDTDSSAPILDAFLKVQKKIFEVYENQKKE
jgi:two-component system sensor histidine kinase/response regulator